jgi:small-conductance mechanosensitive channel
VDLQDQSPRDIANHVAVTVKKHARPWRAIIALVLAVGAAAVSESERVGVRSVFKSGSSAPPVTSRVIWASATIAFCVFGVIAIIGLAGKARAVLSPRAGTAHAAVVRYTILLVGAVIMAIAILALLKIPVTQLLVGGAVTTIFIGIAAQQSLGNVFAGLVLLFSRPFLVGDRILLLSGSLGGRLQGTVTEIGLTYLRLETEDGVMSLPNSAVLAAGVGHAPPPGPSPASIDAAVIGQGSADGSAPMASGTGTGPSDGSPATASPPSGAPPGGEPPGSGGRPLSPPGL